MSPIKNREDLPVCPVSGASDNLLLCRVDGYDIWRCPGSATDFVWPMPDEKSLQKVYAGKEWFEGGHKGGYRNYDEQTEGLLPMFDDLLRQHEERGVGSILDIGCGYGTHLARARERGWKTFGVEVSEHAREVAKQRHGDRLFIVDDVEKLIPHEFDLIILFDVIEHLRDPYWLFYKLFSKGAIAPKTKVIITTPNARSGSAIADPAGWAYRHPPSHLVYYSAKSFEILLRRLHFENVNIVGIHPEERPSPARFSDEDSTINRELAGFAGLLCHATDSNFKEFMHERYVPGTWSKLAEYEHLPRYAFAKTMAKDLRVLDFGCGTGYGSALLSEIAQSVLGVDIDQAALSWANEHHGRNKLRFEQHSDLGAGFAAGSFDFITCFEVIEHVAEPTQIELVKSFSRILGERGKLVISTPNPEVTAHYGDNPFHLREMTETEFQQLLAGSFKHVRILRQWIRPSVSIMHASRPHLAFAFSESKNEAPPLAFVAICSNESFPDPQDFCYFDGSVDYVAERTGTEGELSAARHESYRRMEILQNLGRTLEQLRHTSEREIAALTAEITNFKSSKIYRLRTAIHQPFSIGKFIRIGYLLAGMATPGIVRERVRPLTSRLKQKFGNRHMAGYRSTAVIPRRKRAARLQNPSAESVSVVIPTKNAGPLLKDVLEGIRRQNFSTDVEILVVDSGSTDETLKLAWAHGAEILEVDPPSFNHGATRNLGIENSSGEIVVLLTQDAIPGDNNLISNLLRAFRDPGVAGCYGRQVPRPEADVLTSRKLNDWVTGRPQSTIRWIEEIEAYERLTPWERYEFCNFDNVCSAVRKGVWSELPFPARSSGEDIAWGKLVIEHGWKIAYEPAAWVVHSHDRPIKCEYKRTYLCHRTLYELFGLHSVPTLLSVGWSAARSIKNDWLYALRNEKDLRRRLRLMAQVPFLNTATAYAQYRGAADAKTQKRYRISGDLACGSC